MDIRDLLSLRFIAVDMLTREGMMAPATLAGATRRARRLHKVTARAYAVLPHYFVTVGGPVNVNIDLSQWKVTP